MLKNLISSLLLTTAICGYSSQALAVSQPKHHAIEQIEKDVGFIDIAGEINDNTADVVHHGFRDFEAHNIKQVMIHLNSLGGSLTPGTEIVTEIQDAESKGINVVTFVDHHDVCASMCTGIYAVGSDRMAAADTIWIFHGPQAHLSDDDKKNEKLVREVNETIKQAREYMLSLYRLADPDWTDRVLKPYIMSESDDLILTGGQILRDKNEWILIEIRD